MRGDPVNWFTKFHLHPFLVNFMMCVRLVWFGEGLEMSLFVIQYYRKVTVIFFSAFLLFSCGGGDDDSGLQDGSEQLTAYFFDSGVTGLEYSSPSYQGITDNNGGFPYKPNETTTFSYYGLVLGSVVTTTGSAVFTPLDLFSTNDVNDQSVKNTLVFLQTADSDETAANGISLVRYDFGIITPDFSTLDIASADFQNNLLPELQSILDNTLTLVTEQAALGHFNETLNTLNSTTILEGRWITRDSTFGDVTGVLTFVSDGSLMASVFEGCDNNDIYWSATEASARRNCTETILSMNWVLDGSNLTMTGEGLNDSCIIISSSPYAIEANCVFSGSGLGSELTKFSRDITALNNNLIANVYREIEPNTRSYSIQTFNADLSGSYLYVDENGINNSDDTGVFTWTTNQTQISLSGTDGANQFFAETVNFGEDVSGVLNNTTSVLIPDFNDTLVSNFFSHGTAISVYDAIKGNCKGLYNFNNVTPITSSSPGFLRKHQNGGVNDDICDGSMGLGVPEGEASTHPDDYLVSTSVGAFVIERVNDSGYREFCWPVSYSTTSNAGSISVLACSINDSPFEFEIWRSN